MGIYRLVKERYEREARETERKNAEEQARQQRETELRRDASKIASALATSDAERTAANIRGWHLGTEKRKAVPNASVRTHFISPHPSTHGNSGRVVKSTGTGNCARN
jgi:hypothetical protein